MVTLFEATSTGGAGGEKPGCLPSVSEPEPG